MPKRRDKTKVKIVAQAYLNNGLDMSKALKEAGDPNTGNTLWNKASRWRMSDDIQNEIKAGLAQFDKTIANEAYCIFNLVNIINAKETKTRAHALN